MVALSDPSSGKTFWLLRLASGIVLLLLLVIPFALAEVYLRSIGAGDPILYYTNSSYRYAPQPNQKRLGQRGATITIDSKGLRGVKDWTAPAAEKILFIGASATWGGTYVDDKDLYSNIVCMRLEKALHRSFTCGNAGVNSYGVDNMAERIRFKDYSDESAIVVTIAPFNAVRGLNDLDTMPYFTVAPPGPFKGLWESVTLWVWQLQHRRVVVYDRSHDLRVAERSLDNLFAALRETDRPDRKVLLVLIPLRDQLNGREDQLNGEPYSLTKRVRDVLQSSNYDVLDLNQPFSAAATPDALYYSDGGHLELGGHQLVGELIADRLQNFFAKP
jgi:hypothetical protein